MTVGWNPFVFLTAPSLEKRKGMEYGLCQPLALREKTFHLENKVVALVARFFASIADLSITSVSTLGYNVAAFFYNNTGARVQNFLIDRRNAKTEPLRQTKRRVLYATAIIGSMVLLGLGIRYALKPRNLPTTENGNNRFAILLPVLALTVLTLGAEYFMDSTLALQTKSPRRKSQENLLNSHGPLQMIGFDQNRPETPVTPLRGSENSRSRSCPPKTGPAAYATTTMKGNELQYPQDAEREESLTKDSAHPGTSYASSSALEENSATGLNLFQRQADSFIGGSVGSSKGPMDGIYRGSSLE